MLIKAIDGTDIKTLTKGSMKQVLLTCDTCGHETTTTYSNYIQGQRTREFDGKTYCRPCSKAVGGATRHGRPQPHVAERNRRLSGGKHPSWKGGTYINNWGYRMIHVRSGKDPNGSGWNCYELEHRVVMEKHLGREINQGEIIHHINGDKLDNRIENLDLCESEKQHRQAHISLEQTAIELVQAGLLEYDRDTKSYGVSKKLRELLEHPEEGNQQPSPESDLSEGSTTSSYVLSENMKDHERGALRFFDEAYDLELSFTEVPAYIPKTLGDDIV